MLTMTRLAYIFQSKSHINSNAAKKLANRQYSTIGPLFFTVGGKDLTKVLQGDHFKELLPGQGCETFDPGIKNYTLTSEPASSG